MARLTALFEMKDKITRQVERLTSRLRILDRVRAMPIVQIRDQATSAISGIRSKLLSLQGLVATVGVSLLGAGLFESTVGAASELEKQRISLEHFMSKGNPLLDTSNIRRMTDEYLDALRQNANLTPFETGEVVAGGTRALQVAMGDPKEALKLLTIAEDMVALNPGKTLSDGMEAIADARMGEFERIEFCAAA
ncbi:hypothetical protein [Desulforamulus aquiferis]|uniref:Chemotaxis methyl-accepting receptor HlyB-like 4HB MCP domain-containing protein n=1 Tax=Desulforamulus aquiferis TaxID=1397668 RepID=A0AAW7ZCV7_9FIRM|nr:hypothetical protein [Desulforamulus aquiferis]MDO7787123.1 hypothetical protein [Desulforamulus aquiferis]